MSASGTGSSPPETVEDLGAMATAGWRKWIDPALLEAIDSKNASALEALMRPEVEGVHSFQLFSDEFCRMFLEELDNYHATGLPIDRPNSMNNYGIIVNNIGMQPVIGALQRSVLQPIANLLHPSTASIGRFHRNSFVAALK